MQIKTKELVLELDDKTGSIAAFRVYSASM